MSLNPAQLDAVHTRSGPLLVLAGAGTGKTRVVTFRIAELIKHRIRPERILAVTFTNKAADEMRERAGALLGKKSKAKPEISTFHSLCVRILRRNATHLGYPLQFAISDYGDQEAIARSVLREIKGGDALLRPGDLLYQIGRWKNACVRPDQAMSIAMTDKEHLAAIAYRRYQNALKSRGAVDFDDLLLLTEELFTSFPAVRKTEADRFDHLLIDEYQDTNGSQYRIVKALASGHRNLCVVGDDDQSIYGWRGAEVTHILQFKKDWPEAKVVRLEMNYRSTREILDWANRLIAFNKLRHGKTLQAVCSGETPRIIPFEDADVEAESVVADIALRMKTSKRHPRDFAILCRTNEQPRAFEMELRKAKIPYILLGGMSFYDRKEVRDILAYVKVLSSPKDEVSLLRIINLPPRGISQPTVKLLLASAMENTKPLWEIFPTAANVAGLNSTAVNAVQRFRQLIDHYRQLSHHAALTDVLKQLLEEIGYREDLQRQYTEPQDFETRWASVQELINALASFEKKKEKPTWGGFLQDILLTGNEGDDKESKLERDAVALMTLHAAKGLEFPEVYMVGMEEGILPHHRSVDADDDSAIDEERRLCYVGVTRAQKRLTLSYPQTRNKWGKERPTVPSRFLYEIKGMADNPNYLAIKEKKTTHAHRADGPKKTPGKPAGQAKKPTKKPSKKSHGRS